MLILDILNYARKNNISDIHIIEDGEIYFREFSEIIPNKNFPKIKKEDILEISGDKVEEDFIYVDVFKNRYRVSTFLTMGKLGMVIRLINNKPIALKEKFINELIDKKILTLRDGLILVTGATGSGKSTTLANIIEKFNENKNYKILTIEEPIEYIFENKKSLIVQREIGNDIVSYEKALKSSLRQNPDIVVVGEIRDEESLYAVLKLAETGHLVLSTLHTNNAAESINRITSMVTSEKKSFIRNQLSSVLRFILSQELYINKEKREIIPIFEILNNTKAVANLITNDKINQIPNMIESGIENYMITKEKYFLLVKNK